MFMQCEKCVIAHLCLSSVWVNEKTFMQNVAMFSERWIHFTEAKMHVCVFVGR